MNKLITKDLVLDSREVAQMVGKEHKNLLRDIAKYDSVLTSSKLSPLDFFVPTTYIDAKNQARPNYKITEKGCEFISNKLTGEKGIIFTALYVNKFHDMKECINSNKLIDSLKAELSEFVKEQINNVSSKAELNYRPSCASKYDIMTYIKHKLGITKVNKDYELVKERIFIILGAKKWEDIPYEVLKNSISIIDESIDVIKKNNPSNQMSFFEAKKANA